MANNSTTTEYTGASVEEARRTARDDAAPGSLIHNEQVLSEGGTRTVQAVADTEEDARAQLDRSVPPGASVERILVTGEPRTELRTIEAADTSAAEQTLRGELGDTGVILGIQQITEGKKGLFRGRSDATFQANLRMRSVVQMLIREPARISVSVTSDPLEAAASLIHRGQLEDGKILLIELCADQSSNIDALALAAYEFRVRSDSQQDHDRGTAYLKRLQEIGSDTAAFHSVATLDAVLPPRPGCMESFERASSAPVRPGTQVTADLYTLADIAASEFQYQILCTAVDDDVQFRATHRLKGLGNLYQRNAEAAAEEFRAGVQDVEAALDRIIWDTGVTVARENLAANIRYDCRRGEALATLDMGREPEGRQMMAAALTSYRQEFDPS